MTDEELREKEDYKEITKMEAVLKKQCGFDWDGYVTSFNCYSGAKALYDVGYRQVPELPILTDEEVIGDFCKTCDYSLEGCVEHGQQSTCASYQEAMRQKKKVAQAQRDQDAARIGGVTNTDHCIKCNRPLIVPQRLDFVNTPKGKMCMICIGGS